MLIIVLLFFLCERYCISCWSPVFLSSVRRVNFVFKFIYQCGRTCFAGDVPPAAAAAAAGGDGGSFLRAFDTF